MRPPYTAGSQRRVADATAVTKKLQLPEDLIEGLKLAGAIHDTGKIQIPAEILSKPGRLSELEFRFIKEHPKFGYKILKSIHFSGPIDQTVLQHHERLDGTGYPHVLKDKEILLEGKILEVADVVEAIGSHRPYRAVLGVDAPLEEISRHRGVLYLVHRIAADKVGNSSVSGRSHLSGERQVRVQAV